MQKKKKRYLVNYLLINIDMEENAKFYEMNMNHEETTTTYTIANHRKNQIIVKIYRIQYKFI